VELIHAFEGKSDLLCGQVKISHIAVQEYNNNKHVVVECLSDMLKTSHVTY
jgi:hypothetical protein